MGFRKTKSVLFFWVAVAQLVERVVQSPEGWRFDPGSNCLHAKVSLGKTLNPNLPPACLAVLCMIAAAHWCVNG